MPVLWPRRLRAVLCSASSHLPTRVYPGQSGAHRHLFAPDIRNGYVYEWSLSYEHALTPNTVLSLSYTGSDGHKLPRRGLQNQGVPNLPGERRGYHPQPGSNQFIRDTDVNSNYNALVARLERRFSGGLSFVAAYTYAKSLDTASGLDGTDQPQDNYNMRAEYGLSDFDMRQRVSFSGVWQLPFGSKAQVGEIGGSQSSLWRLADGKHRHASERTAPNRRAGHCFEWNAVEWHRSPGPDR